MPTDTITFTALPSVDQAHILQFHRTGLLWVYEPPDDHDPEPCPIHVAAIGHRTWWQEWMASAPDLAALVRTVTQIPEEPRHG
jgi:hypothetical protein